MKMDILLDEEIDPNVEEGSIYSEDVRDQLLEDDEISPSELAFMNGYDGAYI